MYNESEFDTIGNRNDEHANAHKEVVEDDALAIFIKQAIGQNVNPLPLMLKISHG